MQKDSKIYVAGHTGLVGSAIVRRLKADGYSNIVTISHRALDLSDYEGVADFFDQEKPEYVFLAAAKVGGIKANDYYAGEFIYENLNLQTNVIDRCLCAYVKKLLFLGSSCIYPRNAPQPITEDALMTGPLEPTNEAYAIAKIAGIKMLQAYRKQYGFNGICAMPCNLYGPGDNFDLETSHVIPALIRKFHEAKVSGAKSVTVWGTGEARREFLHVDDLARALVMLMNDYDDERIINVGAGFDRNIWALADDIRDVTGFQRPIQWDNVGPDGTPRKLMDSSRIAALGWKPEISLHDGLEQTYKWYLEYAA